VSLLNLLRKSSLFVANHLEKTHTTVIAGIWEILICCWAMRKPSQGKLTLGITEVVQANPIWQKLSAQLQCHCYKVLLLQFKCRFFCTGMLITHHHHHHHHVCEGLVMLACSLILQMKLVPPSLPRSPYVPSSFQSVLQCLFWYSVCVHSLYVL
jgi:hypothetical protein